MTFCSVVFLTHNMLKEMTIFLEIHISFCALKSVFLKDLFHLWYVDSEYDTAGDILLDISISFFALKKIFKAK